MAFVGSRVTFLTRRSLFSSLSTSRQIKCCSCCSSVQSRKSNVHHQTRNIHTSHINRTWTIQDLSHKLTSSTSWRWRSPVASVSAAAAVAATETNNTAVIDPSSVDYIPPPPPSPEDLIPDPSTLNILGEPTFVSLDLAHWTPPGLIQAALEHMHVGMGLPWWGAIMAGTVVLRFLVFPLVVKAQKNAARLHNNLPTMTRLQERFTEARKGGNVMEAAKSSNELMSYMKRNEINPLKSFIVPLAQIPIFLSVFLGLRKLANLPVESFREGGILWFTDLTICDPYYILPLFTMSSFLITLEMGADGIATSQQGQFIRYFLRAMPFLILPVIIKFPSALLLYWATSNSCSLLQVLLLRTPGLREKLGVERRITHPKVEPGKKKGFVQGIKETINNSKKMAEMDDRARSDEVRFQQAGTGPVVKTFKYDPTKKRT